MVARLHQGIDEVSLRWPKTLAMGRLRAWQRERAIIYLEGYVSVVVVGGGIVLM